MTEMTMTMNTLTKEKIRRVFYFLEDEINAHVASPDKTVVTLRIPVRRLLARTSASTDDLRKLFYKMRSDDVLRRKDTDDLENKHTTALDSVMLEIDIPKFFEYKKIILGEGPKPDHPKPESEDLDLTPSNSRPFCVVEDGWGYLKFGKYGEKIEIGSPESRHFRLLQCLSEPLGRAKTIEAVFDSIKLPKDKNDSELSGYDSYRRKGRQITLVEYAIKELQKGNKLQNKLRFKFDDTKNKLWLEYIG